MDACVLESYSLINGVGHGLYNERFSRLSFVIHVNSLHCTLGSIF